MNAVAARRPWVLLACFLVLAVLFYFANRAAYKGYFSDDDLDNLGWPTYVGKDVYVHGLLTIKFEGLNFRPVGALYYRLLYHAFHLNFPPYVIVLQLIHAFNVMMLFFILRRLDVSPVAAGAGALFYSFHAAVMQVFWMPMYVFDLLCATFCLITFWLYISGRWILALIPFWLAYKSKEIAVMLPLALLAWEWLFGGRKFRRLIPYLLISLIFGVQVLFWNRTVDPDATYSFSFAPRILWQITSFYASAIFFTANLGLALFLLPIWVRDRLLYLGLMTMTALIAPMLTLHLRVAAVYWYVPMIGLAMVVAAIAARTPRWAIALLFLIWLPFNYAALRIERGKFLAQGSRDRAVVSTLQDYARRIPSVRAVVFENFPNDIDSWGLHGAIRQAFGPSVDSAWAQDPDVSKALSKVPMALIHFHEPPLSILGLVRTHDGLQPYLRFTDLVQESQFGDGWYNRGEIVRWIAPRAECDFYRPQDAVSFNIEALIPEASLQKDGPAHVTLLEDGRSLGTVTLSSPGRQTLSWKLASPDPADKHITILTKPGRHGDAIDPRTLGIAVTAIGYALH